MRADPPSFTLRPARPGDVAAIVRMIGELAEFEQLTHLLQVTPEKLHPQLFGERPVVEAIVAEWHGDAPQPGEGTRDTLQQGNEAPLVAFALFFTNFSTFLSVPGLYLEDLFVKPARRGSGIGAAMLTHLGQLAVERGYGRFEWSVLDWNENAIRFYQRMGATVMPDWRICRITGDALQAFGKPSAPTP
jgi:GNAT superfamily N-acetyltransferase